MGTAFPTRRQFLLAAGAVGGAGVAGGAGAWAIRLYRFPARALSVALDASRIEVPEKLRTLTAFEYLALAAATERIFPEDGTPGAIGLGVPLYVDRWIETSPEPSWSDGMRAGLARLDAAANKGFGVPFHLVRPADQDAMLGALEADEESDDADFLQSLVEATIEGALCNPSYGGNIDSAGWTGVGLRADPYSTIVAKR